MYKRALICIGLVLLLGRVTALANENSCGCPNQAAVSRVEALRNKCAEPAAEELPEVYSQMEPTEWQCIVVDIIIEYVNCETRPCDSLYGACMGLCTVACPTLTIAACGAIFAQGSPLPAWCYFAGYPCIDFCPNICEWSVIECEYCESDVTIIWSCGLVFTE